MNCARRDLALLLPALAAAEPQDKTLPTKIYKYEDLPARASGQNHSRAVLNGENHSGIPIELHMTELGPGQAPHPPHHHVHEEILMLRTGSLDITIGGQTTRVTPGSIVYVASGQEHGWKNPGATPAEYFVLALGKDA